MAERENDNRGDDLHRQNESFLRDRIRALEARVKELEEQLSEKETAGSYEVYKHITKGPGITQQRKEDDNVRRAKGYGSDTRRD